MSAKHNIQQRGNTFRVDITKNGARQRVTCATLEEAQAIRAKLELASVGEVVDQWTLQTAFQTCYEKVWKKGKNVEASYRNGQAAVDFFGATTLLDAITTERVDAWIARLQQIGNGEATINRKLAALSKIMSYARHRNKMRQRPHLERQCENKNGRIRFLTQEEEAQVLSLLTRRGKDCHAEAVCVLVDTGIRPSELWRVEARDCNILVGVLTVWLTKNGKSRSVPMTQRVRDIMARRIEQHPTGPLFPHNNSWMRGAWDWAKAEMGLKSDDQFVPYALRHTCASRLVQRGVGIKVVKDWMGHKTITMTDRYGHLNPQNLFDAVKVLEAC